MTVDLALNRKDKDLVFNVNSQGFAELIPITGADRIAQKIVISLNFWLKDWFLDQSKGVPYIEIIFVKQTRKSTIENLLRQAILLVQGVNQITDFVMSLDNQTRLLRVEFICDTVEGVISNSTLLDAIR